jgi:tripartite-type tricarboxylate transporter receptor subunit TctC
MPNLLNQLIATKFKVITGYNGANAALLAALKGETEGTADMAWDSMMATHATSLKRGDLRILVQIGLQHFPPLGQTPSAIDSARSEGAKQVLELALAKLEYGRSLVMPPGVPVQVVELMRRAFQAMCVDKEFMQQAKTLRVELVATSGSEIQEFLQTIYATSRAIVAKTREALIKAGQVGLN